MSRYPLSNDIAAIIRAVLVLLLGGKCVKCGCELLSALEIDHPEGRDWSPRKLSRLNRAIRYCDEYVAGVPLGVLCRHCNAVDGALKGTAWWCEREKEHDRQDRDQREGDVPF